MQTMALDKVTIGDTYYINEKCESLLDSRSAVPLLAGNNGTERSNEHSALDKGHFRLCAMPLRLKNAPVTFPRIPCRLSI